MRFLLIVVVTISIINLNVHYIFNLIIRGLVRRYCQSFSVLLNFASCKIFGDKMIIDEYWISSVIRRKKISEVQVKGGKFKKKWKLSREAKVVFSPFMMKWLFSLKYISAKSFDQVPSFLLFVIVLLLCFILVLLLLLFPEDFRTGIQRNRGWHYSLSFLYVLWT